LFAPEDFGAYWQGTEAELAGLDPAPELTVIPMRSTFAYTYYECRLTSLGRWRTCGYFSKPNGSGPHPAVVFAPPYGSVAYPPPSWAREKYVTFTVRSRGMRGSDSPSAGFFPGFMTTGVEDRQRFIYRGVLCDLLRGFDYVAGRVDVDRARIAIVGKDGVSSNLALAAGALRPFVAGLALTIPDWVNLSESLPAAMTYPLAEFHHYFRAYPERREAALETMRYYDALSFAPHVCARVLLQKAPASELAAASLTASRGVEIFHDSGNPNFVHTQRQITWVAEVLEA